LVSDVRHYFDLPDGVSNSLVKLAQQQFDIVRAATTRLAGPAWETAIACTRRPGRSACPGFVVVIVAPGESIRWTCPSCTDGGVISGWPDTVVDLRPTITAPIADPVACELSVGALALMRRAALLEGSSERIVCGAARSGPSRATVVGACDEIDLLIDALSAESDHEPNRTRRGVLDGAIEALGAALADGR